MASSRSTVRLAKHLTQQVPADASTEPVSPSPQQSKTSNPHRTSPQPRGFVHGRFPYAGPMPRRATSDGRHPKTFTIHVIQRNPPRAPKRTFMQPCLVTEMGGELYPALEN